MRHDRHTNRPTPLNTQAVLLLVALAVTVGTLIFAGYALMRSKFAEDQATVAMFEVGQLLDDMSQAGVEFYDGMLQSIAQPGAMDLDRLEQLRERIADQFVELRAYLTHDAAEKTLFAVADEARLTYLTHEDRIMELLRAGDAAGAGEYLTRPDYQNDFAEFGLTFQELMNGMRLGAERAYERGERRETIALVFASGSILIIAVLWGLILVDWLRQMRIATRQSELAQRARAKLADLNGELERRVLERTRELEEARARAEAANKAKSEFLASMSHELRTPLNGVLGMSSVLRSTPLEAAQSNMLDVIETSGRSLLVLLNDVLDFARLEAGKLEIRAEPFDMTEMLEKTVALHRLDAEAKGLALRLEVADSARDVFIADETRIGQLVGNLLSNAVKFTDSGSVRVTASHDGQRARIAVRDTGCGIDPSAIDRIFERFSQIDGSTKRRHGGAGLGLALSRELATAMDGTIGVDTAQGQGSEFWVEIPMPRWTSSRGGAAGDARAA